MKLGYKQPVYLVILLILMTYFVWLLTSQTTQETFLGFPWAPVLPQCQKWHNKRGIWKIPPFSWLDAFYTFWTELFIGIYWTARSLF